MYHEKLRGLVCYMYMMGLLIFSDLSYYDSGEFGRHHSCLSEGEDVFLSHLAIVPKDKTSDNRQPALQHFYQNQQQPQVSVYGSK